MDRRPHCRPAHAERGFTLIEIVVVLLIVSVLIGMAAAMTRGVVATQQRSLTGTRIAGIDAALAQFVATQKRLPCPADGTVAPGDLTLGTEINRSAAGCTGNQANGIVPFRALGLTELDALDGWSRRMTYRVDPILAADNAMDMSDCDPAGTRNSAGGPIFLCSAGCTPGNMGNCTPPQRFLTKDVIAADPTKWGKGLRVKNVAGGLVMDPNLATWPPTGAAYVVISAGETGGGAYLPSGTLGSTTSTDGTEEKRNYATVAFVNTTATYFVDDTPTTAAGVSHYDDVISHPSIFAVLIRAGLGPRVH